MDSSKESKNSRDPVDGSKEESKNSRDPVDGSKESKNSRDPQLEKKTVEVVGWPERIEVNPPNKSSLACSSAWQNWSKSRPGEGVYFEETEVWMH